MLSDSEDDCDKYAKKKGKTQATSGTPGTSRHGFEQKKAKRVARNTRLLLDMNDLIEGIQEKLRESQRSSDVASLHDA